MVDFESPFYSNTYSYTRPTNSTASRTPKKNVVEIPVHFIRSGHSRSESAIKIQKVFRGFRVRKSLKKIIALQREVEEVARKVEERETMELIKRDEKERLKFNEMLMELVFKLNSVKGVDCGVRDCRKGVIRRALLLQEKIDSFVVDGVDDNAVVEEQIGGNSEEIDHMDCDSGNIGDELSVEIADKGSNAGDKIDDDNAAVQEQIGANSNEIDRTDSQCGKIVGYSREEIVKEGDNAGDCNKIGDEMSGIAVEGGQLRGENMNMEGVNEDWFVVGDEDDNKEEKKTSKQRLSEKMTEDNEMLMAMVADLYKRVAAQGNLISLLSQRVEKLEKAMIERELRKKKKKNGTLNGPRHQLM